MVCLSITELNAVLIITLNDQHEEKITLAVLFAANIKELIVFFILLRNNLLNVIINEIECIKFVNEISLKRFPPNRFDKL